MELTRDDFRVSDDKSRLDLDVVCELLQATYWAGDRPREVIQRAIEHSVCVGLYHGTKQIGFARAVTDFATFTWICDVIVATQYRGRGLGKWMVEALIEHESLQTVTQVLRTRDAHSLYTRFGFERTEYLRRSRADWAKRPGAV